MQCGANNWWTIDWLIQVPSHLSTLSIHRTWQISNQICGSQVPRKMQAYRVEAHRASIHFLPANGPARGSLHRPYPVGTTSNWLCEETGAAVVPGSRLSHHRLEQLEQSHHSQPVSSRLWCHTQLCLLTVGLSLMVTLNAALLMWILSYLNFDQVRPLYFLYL